VKACKGENIKLVEIVGHATEENKGKPERGYSAEITTNLKGKCLFFLRSSLKAKGLCFVPPSFNHRTATARARARGRPLAVLDGLPQVMFAKYVPESLPACSVGPPFGPRPTHGKAANEKSRRKKMSVQLKN